MKHFVIAIACLLTFASVKAGEFLPRHGNDFDCGYCTPMEINMLAALLGDGMLREMVCRLSYGRYTPGNLSSSIGMPEGQVLRRINTLRGWGLIRLARQNSATTIIEPLPGNGEQTLRRWAYRYCPQGNACGIPSANLNAQKDTRASRTVSVRTDTSHVNDETSLKGKLITVFGSSGFVGRHLVKRLLNDGAKIRAIVREPNTVSLLKRLEKQGKIDLFTLDIGMMEKFKSSVISTRDSFRLYEFRDEDKIQQAIAGSDAVINLTGISSQKGPQTFGAVHFHGSRQIAQFATMEKVERLVHVSSISADPDSPSLHDQTKALGEDFVWAMYPSATIVRPSVIFGPEDHFINHIASFLRFSPIMPLFDGGKNLSQPVYVGDVTEAIVRILKNPESRSSTYELGGPRIMTTREISSLVMQETERKRLFVSIPFWIARTHASLDWLPSSPLIQDYVNLMQKDHIVDSQALGLTDLGIIPTPIEDVLTSYLGNTGKRSIFDPAY